MYRDKDRSPGPAYLIHNFKTYCVFTANKTMQVREIVLQKVMMYDCVVNMCTDAATRIYKEKIKSIEGKKKVCEEILETCYLAKEFCKDGARPRYVRRLYDSDYTDDIYEIGFIMESNEVDNLYVCTYLRFDLDKDREESFWKISCIHCETTDSDIDVKYEGEECMFYMVNRPHEKRETYKDDEYAIWSCNRTDPWQDMWLVDYAIAGDQEFDSFYREYCEEFGEEYGDYRNPIVCIVDSIV